VFAAQKMFLVVAKVVHFLLNKMCKLKYGNANKMLQGYEIEGLGPIEPLAMPVTALSVMMPPQAIQQNAS